MKPLFSVVIPTYNRASSLQRSLDSVLAQSYDNFEILVMDDGSTDNTAEVVASFADPRITYRWDKNFGGPARPRNRGIALAKGEWVAFLDSDDWWAPNKLEFSFTALNAGADIIYHDLYLVRVIDQTVFKERTFSNEPIHPMFQALLCAGVSVPNSSVVVRRDLLIQAGPVSEKRELISVEDCDTWIRLSRLTEKFVRIPKCFGCCWIGGGNISAASLDLCSRRSALYDQYLGELNDSERRQAEGFLAYQIGRIAQQYGDRTKAQSNLLIALLSPIAFVYRVKSIYFLVRNMLSGRFA